jgi:UDP-N-acetyl-2-amino-2-deoxyglucuronate dehydrogenase
VLLLGDQGTIRNNRVFSRKWVGQRGWATIPIILPDGADGGDVSHHPFRDEVDHFVECILANHEYYANLEDAAVTHEICFASAVSAREKRPVSIPAIKESN